MNKTLKAALAGTIGALLVLNGVALATIDTGKKYPSAWDPRIAPLAAFVEDARHLRFDHPVEVRFLTPEEYKNEITGGEDGDVELSDEEKKEIEQFEGLFRALGLIGDDTSLLDETEQLETEGTAAFYDPDTEEIVVYGTELDIDTKVTLVHELTHAAQDQNFDLSRDFEGDGASSLFKALGEGDATRMEAAYVDQLPESEQEEYYESGDEESGETEDDRSLEGVSPALLQLFGAPYALGGPMTTIFTKVQGVKQLDLLFQDPINSEEGMINPFALLDREKPKTVKAPALVSGEKLFDEGDQFGVITWYLMLASFVDARTALHAVDGWGGDAYVGYDKGGKSCVKAAFVGDTANDSTEMLTALNEWKKSFPAESVVVSGDANRVELAACEPTKVPTPRQDSGESLTLPIVRMQLLAEVLDGGMPRNIAQCFITRIIDTVPLAKLISDDEAVGQELFQIGTNTARACAQSLAV